MAFKYEVQVNAGKNVHVKIYQGAATPYRYYISRKVNGSEVILKNEEISNGAEAEHYWEGLSEFSLYTFWSEYYHPHSVGGDGTFKPSQIKDSDNSNGGNLHWIHFVDYNPHDDDFDLKKVITLS